MVDYMDIIEKLFDGQYLVQVEVFLVFNQVMYGELLEVKLVILLMVLKMNGELFNEIVGVVSVMVLNVWLFLIFDYVFGDIVGIGGDGYYIINIFSVVVLVVVSCGIKVVKYGN